MSHFVIYSPSLEKHSIDREDFPPACYWSNQFGWVSRDEASLFTQEQVRKFNLPKVDDAGWVRA